MTDDGFARRLLAWYRRHGRHDLPWRQTRDPYAIWISEIMLQQTQVATVLPYYRRFMAAFPDVARLAGAPLDAVLAHWSGLGYYARARNLHAAARRIVTHHGGRLPDDPAALQALPGIGRSTAGAILALAFHRPAPILDGNVRRVLCRYRAVPGWPGDPAVERRLWALAQALTPARRAHDYTQAIMDLGAGVCTRSRPRCPACPQRHHCRAHARGQETAFPRARPRRARPRREVAMILARDPRGRVLLARRPPAGLWGGLWSLPECDPGEDVAAWCRQRLGLAVRGRRDWPVLEHGFTHFVLHIHPVLVDVTGTVRVMEHRPTVWYNPQRPGGRGLAAPVRRLLERLGSIP